MTIFPSTVYKFVPIFLFKSLSRELGDLTVGAVWFLKIKTLSDRGTVVMNLRERIIILFGIEVADRKKGLLL